MKPVLVIMAAGMGSRYGGLKQLDPVGEFKELIIDYSIFDAKRAGFDKVIFIINRRIEEDFKAVIGNRIAKNMEVAYVYQELKNIPDSISIPSDRVKPWGTAHAIYAAIPEIGKAPFVVINADDYYGKDAFEKIYNSLDSDSEDFHMVGYKLKNTVTENGSVSRGVCEIKEGYLKDIVERTKIVTSKNGIKYIEDDKEVYLSDDTVVSMNMWGLNSNFLREIERGIEPFLLNAIKSNPLKCEYFLPYVVGELIKKNYKVRVLTTDEKWYGVTYKEDKESVVQAIKDMTKTGKYPRNLWK